MSQTLLARAQALLNNKPGALALAVIPIAALASRPTRVQASVLFTFTDAGLMDPQNVPPTSVISPLADEGLSASALYNGGVHIIGVVGTLHASDLGYAHGVNVYGGSYSGAVDVHAEGTLSGTIQANELLNLGVLLNLTPS